MTTKEEFDSYLKDNGYVKKSEVTKNTFWKYVALFSLGMLFISVILYGINTDGFKSNIQLNNTINPQTDVLNNYDFKPATDNFYNMTFVNNITVVNTGNCS